MNWYTYAANNPLRFVDLTGLAYEDFVEEMQRRIDRLDQEALAFGAIKDCTVALPSVTNIGYRDSLAQIAGGTKIAKAQASLVIMEYDLGSFGKREDGIDGKQGDENSRTSKAIRHFQLAVGLRPSGNLDPKTIEALDLAVKAGLTREKLIEKAREWRHAGLVRVNMPLPKDSSRYREFTPYLDVSAADAFNAAVAEIQGREVPLVMSEGFRTRAYQEYLRRKYPRKAAIPGTSPHESGLAVDVDMNPLSDPHKEIVIEVMAQYGFYRTVMPKEPWHFSFVEDRKARIEYNAEDWLRIERGL